MLRRGKLIVFLGPTGVGKSTIIRYLVQALRIRGFRVSTIFIKGYHGPAYVLWVLVAKLLGIKESYAPWFIIPRSGRVGLAKVLTMVSMYLDTFLSILLKLMKIKLLRGIGYYIISEEYLHLTLLDYDYSIASLKIKSRFVSIPKRILNALLSKNVPDSVIVLMTDVSELRRRWAIRGYGDPQPYYVAIQQKFLNKIGHALIIDSTNMSIEETLNKILDEVIREAS